MKSRPLELVAEFKKAANESCARLRAEISDPKYGKNNDIVFSFRGKVYSVAEPIDVLPVGNGEASKSWALRQILDNNFTILS